MEHFAMSGLDDTRSRSTSTTPPWQIIKARDPPFSRGGKLFPASAPPPSPPRLTTAMDLMSMVISWSQLRTLRHSRALEARDTVIPLRARGRPLLGRRDVNREQTTSNACSLSPSLSNSTLDRSADSPSSAYRDVWDMESGENAGFMPEKHLPPVTFAPEVPPLYKQTTSNGEASGGERFTFPHPFDPQPVDLGRSFPVESELLFPPRRRRESISPDFTLCKLVPVPGTGEVVEARLLRIVPATPLHRQAVLELGTKDGTMSDLDFLPDQFLHLCQDSATFSFVGEMDGQVMAYSCIELVDGQQTAFRLCGRGAGVQEFCRQVYAHFLVEMLGVLRDRLPSLCRDAFITSLDHCLTHGLHHGYQAVLIRKALCYRLTLLVSMEEVEGHQENLVELTETDLAFFFSRKLLLGQTKLFSEGHVVVGWQAYRILPINAAAIFRYNVLALGSASRGSVELDLTLVSLGCFWPCKLGLCYVVHCYGDLNTASKVHAHLRWHCLRATLAAQACRAAAVEMQVFVGERDPSHSVVEVMEDKLKLAKGKSVPPMVLLETPIPGRVV